MKVASKYSPPETNYFTAAGVVLEFLGHGTESLHGHGQDSRQNYGHGAHQMGAAATCTHDYGFAPPMERSYCLRIYYFICILYKSYCYVTHMQD